jgi:hypothetical protein
MTLSLGYKLSSEEFAIDGIALAVKQLGEHARLGK